MPPVALLALCLAAAPAPEELTLDQAVALALKNNRLVRNAELEVRKAEEELAATRTHRLPSFSLNVLETQLATRLEFLFPRGAFGTFPAIGPVPAADTPITTGRHPTTLVLAQAAQPLSQLYRINLGVRLRGLSRDVVRERLRARQQAVSSEVKKVYYGLLQAQSALEATEQAIKLYTELDRVVTESLAQQVVLKADSLEVQTRLAKAQHEAVTLRNALATQQEQLNELLGRDLTTPFRLSPAPEPTPAEADLAEARTRALRQRPEIQESRLSLRQAEYNRSLKKAEYIPEVSFTLSYLSPFQIRVLPKNVVAGGLLLNWDVFDWGRKRRELAARTLTIEQARNGIAEAEAQIAVEVGGRYRKLEEARALLRVSELGVQTARERVRVATNRFREKSALLKDVLETQAALAGASHQYQQALLSFWTARADFEKSLGE